MDGEVEIGGDVTMHCHWSPKEVWATQVMSTRDVQYLFPESASLAIFDILTRIKFQFHQLSQIESDSSVEHEHERSGIKDKDLDRCHYHHFETHLSIATSSSEPSHFYQNLLPRDL